MQKRQDAPIEYLTNSFIAGASALMDGKYAILVDKSKNWVDHPILWTAIVGNTSQKKSPCLDLFKRIIDSYEADLNTKYERNRLLKNPNLSIKQPIEHKQPKNL